MVVHVHGGLFLTAPRIPFILERILKWVFSWDVPFIVLSEGEKEILKNRFGAKRVEVLANCPEGPKGNGNGLRACSPEHLLERKNSLNCSEGALVPSSARLSTYGAQEPAKHPRLTLGYLGRIEPNKGMGELLSAVERLKSEGRKIRLRIAGKEEREGEYLPKFREALGEDFEYCGLVSGERKREFLESLEHVGGVFADVDAHALSEVLGKLFAQEVVGAHIPAAIFVVGVRTVEGKHDYLLAQPCAISGSDRFGGFAYAYNASPGGLNDIGLRLLLARAE